MSRIAYCPACSAQAHGVKSRIAIEHTCGLETGAINQQDDETYYLQSGNVGTEIKAGDPITDVNFEKALKKFKETPWRLYYSWQSQIENYCQQQGITPLQLIEAHKKGHQLR